MPTPELSADEVAHALSFLSLGEIMPLRSVNMTWKDAAKKTIVPPTNFIVNSVKRCNAMSVMARVLPNLQQVTLRGLRCDGIKYSDGEDPDEALASEFRNAVCNIEIMSNFRKLRVLEIDAGLNGRYPFLFNFPLLQKLSISHCYYLKWDLDMLAGLPMLKDLECSYNPRLTSNIRSLRALKDTLELVQIIYCENVEGNFMDLADFPHLNMLNLLYTTVTGDIRDIGKNDFPSLEQLELPKGVYGGHCYEFQRISDGPELMRAVYLFNKQRPFLLDMEGWYVKLSDDSPDWYESVHEDEDTPPFFVCFVEAGPRVGYRWETLCDDPCEVNWLDPEPEIGSSGYEDYVADYHRIRKADFYRGYYDPPSEEEYNLLHEEIFSESDEDED